MLPHNRCNWLSCLGGLSLELQPSRCATAEWGARMRCDMRCMPPAQTRSQHESNITQGHTTTCSASNGARWGHWKPPLSQAVQLSGSFRSQLIEIGTTHMTASRLPPTAHSAGSPFSCSPHFSHNHLTLFTQSHSGHSSLRSSSENSSSRVTAASLPSQGSFVLMDAREPCATNTTRDVDV